MVALRPLVDYQENLGEDILCGESRITPIHNFEASNLGAIIPTKNKGGYGDCWEML